MSSTPSVIKLSSLSSAIDKAMVSDEQKLKNILESLKISATEQLQPPQIALQMVNRKTDGYSTLGTLGNFSLIIGKAKSRKSFYVNIAVSTAISSDLVLGLFKSELPINQNEVLYFDTEQGKYHVQLALKRICKQVNIEEPENLHVYHLRSKTPAERLELIEYAIYSNDRVGIVVIDGIKDLVTSINDEAEATMIATKLLKWSEERNIHIMTVLHQNKSDSNARGHIGSELINKAETVLSISKADADSNISIMEPQQCRNIEPETFAFEIIDGLPTLAENFELRTETKKSRFDVTGMEDFKKYQLLTEVFSKSESLSYKELEIQIKLASKRQLGKELGTNSITALIADCKNNSWLVQEKPKTPYKIGNFKENQNSTFFNASL